MLFFKQSFGAPADGGVPTHDEGTNKRASGRRQMWFSFARRKGVAGFELGLEMTVKAFLIDFAEIPSVWRD